MNKVVQGADRIRIAVHERRTGSGGNGRIQIAGGDPGAGCAVLSCPSTIR